MTNFNSMTSSQIARLLANHFGGSVSKDDLGGGVLLVSSPNNDWFISVAGVDAYGPGVYLAVPDETQENLLYIGSGGELTSSTPENFITIAALEDAISQYT